MLLKNGCASVYAGPCRHSDSRINLQYAPVFVIINLMYKPFNILYPVLVVIGVLFVVLFDQGSGLDSPGIWLIPVGVIGIMFLSIINGNAKRLKPLFIAWALSLLSILGLYYGWFTEGFDGLIWVLPAAGFTLIGFVLLVIEAFRNLRK